MFARLLIDGRQLCEPARLEMVLGLRMLAEGRTTGAVNGYLTEMSAARGGEPRQMIIFGEDIERSNGGFTARFTVSGEQKCLFEVVYTPAPDDRQIPVGEMEVVPVTESDAGSITVSNFFRAGDRVVIRRLDAAEEISPQDLYAEIVGPAYESFRAKAREGVLSVDDLLDWADVRIKPFVPELTIEDLAPRGEQAGLKTLRRFAGLLTRRALIRLGLFVEIRDEKDAVAGEITGLEKMVSPMGNSFDLITLRGIGDVFKGYVVSSEHVVEPHGVYGRLASEAGGLRKKWKQVRNDRRYVPGSPRTQWNFYDYVVLRTFGTNTDEGVTGLARELSRGETFSLLDCLVHFKRIWGREPDPCDPEDNVRLALSIVRPGTVLADKMACMPDPASRAQFAKHIIDFRARLGAISNASDPLYPFVVFMKELFHRRELSLSGGRDFIARAILGHIQGQRGDFFQLEEQSVVAAWLKYAEGNWKQYDRMKRELLSAARKALEEHFLDAGEMAGMLSPPEDAWFDREAYYRDVYMPSVRALVKKRDSDGVSGRDVMDWIRRVINRVDPAYAPADTIDPEQSFDGGMLAAVIRRVSAEALIPLRIVIEFQGSDMEVLCAGTIRSSAFVDTPGGNRVELITADFYQGIEEGIVSTSERVVMPAGDRERYRLALRQYAERGRELPRSYGVSHRDWDFGDWVRFRYLPRIPVSEDPLELMRQPAIHSALNSADIAIYAKSLLGHDFDSSVGEDTVRVCEAVLRPGSPRSLMLGRTEDPRDRELLASALLFMENQLASIRLSRSPAYCVYRMMIGSILPVQGIQIPPREAFASRMMFTLMGSKLFGNPTDDRDAWREYLRSKAFNMKQLGKDFREAADAVYRENFLERRESVDDVAAPAVALVLESGAWRRHGLTEEQHTIVNRAYGTFWSEGYELPPEDPVYRDIVRAMEDRIRPDLYLYIHIPPDEVLYDELYKVDEKGVLPPRGTFRLVTHPGTYRDGADKPRSCNLLVPAGELSAIKRLRQTDKAAYREWIEHEVSHLADRAVKVRGREQSEKRITEAHGITRLIEALSGVTRGNRPADAAAGRSGEVDQVRGGARSGSFPGEGHALSEKTAEGAYGPGQTAHRGGTDSGRSRGSDPGVLYEFIMGRLDPGSIERDVFRLPWGMHVAPGYREMLTRRSGLLHTGGTIREIFSLTGISRGDSVLEIGPGQSIMPVLSALLGAEVTVVEPSRRYRAILKAMIDVFRNEISQAGGHIHLIEDDIDNSVVRQRLEDSHFDVVVCLDVINNIADRMGQVFPGADTIEHGIRDRDKQRRLVSTIARVVKKRHGVIFISLAGGDEHAAVPDAMEEAIAVCDGRILEVRRTYSMFIPEKRSAWVCRLSERDTQDTQDFTALPEIAYGECGVLGDQNRDESALLAVTQSLGRDTPVNVYIDISAIPHRGLAAEKAEEELAANMRTIAYLIARARSAGVNARYILTGVEDRRRLDKARTSLLENVRQLPVTDNEVLSESISAGPHSGRGKIDLFIQSYGEGSGEGAEENGLSDNQYIIALDDEGDGEGYVIPNYSAAFTVGLVIASLRAVKDSGDDEAYDAVLPRAAEYLANIFERYGARGEETERFSPEELNLMITGRRGTRVYFALRYALMPVAKSCIERLDEYHRTLHLFLQAV